MSVLGGGLSLKIPVHAAHVLASPVSAWRVLDATVDKALNDRFHTEIYSPAAIAIRISSDMLRTLVLAIRLAR